MKKYIYRLLGFIMLIQLIGCKSEVIKKEYDTQIKVTIVDLENKPLKDADVVVFDNFENYTESIRLASPQKAIYTLKTDSNGIAIITNLPVPTEGNYANEVWVASFYRGVLSGYTILYDNDSINYKPAETYRKGSINEVTLKLKPAEGLVTFYVDSSQNSRLPIYLYNSKLEIDTLTVSHQSDLESINANLSTKVFKKGNQIWRAKSQECDWYGVVNVIAGKQTVVQLPQCEIGQLAFYSNDLGTDTYPIYIRFKMTYGGGYDTIAVINTAAIGFTPVDCSPDPDVVVSLPKGEGLYIYDAISADGKTSWIDTVTVKRNQCRLVALKVAN